LKRALVNDVRNESRAREKSERIEQLVNLHKMNVNATIKWKSTDRSFTIVYATYG